MRRELQREVETVEGIPIALNWVEAFVRAGLPGGTVRISIGRPKRTLDQNAKFHAMCQDVARQKQYMGRWLNAQQWKVLFVSAHSIATGQGADVVPGLEGEFVNIRESTAQMSKARLSSLVEYVQAWCASENVRLREVA